MVTHQLEVEHRTGKVRRPKINVLPLCHATDKNRSRLKAASDDADWIKDSRTFHADAAAMGNARSPSVKHWVAGTTSAMSLASEVVFGPQCPQTFTTANGFRLAQHVARPQVYIHVIYVVSQKKTSHL